MKLSDLFPLCTYTNMDYRPDRNSQVLEELTKVGITNPTRLSGVVWEGSSNKTFNGQIGCGLAHLKGLKLAKELNQNVIMFEDDVLFINDFNTIISNALDELPEDWCMIYLGGNICRSIFQVSDHLGKLTHAQSTHAIGINKNFLDRILSMEDKFYTNVIDVMYGSELVPSSNCYITIPMVAVQRSDFSNIENRKVEYASWMEQRFYEQLIRK